MRGIVRVAMGIALIAGSTQAQAATLTFSDEATFRAGLIPNSIGVETFESKTNIGPANHQSPLALNFLADPFNPASSVGTADLYDPVSASSCTTSQQCVNVLDSPINGRHAVSGTKFINADNSSPFDLYFNGLYTAFGFYATDIGDENGGTQLRLQTYRFNGITYDLLETLPLIGTLGGANGNTLFFGFYSTLAFDAIGIEANSLAPGDIHGFDDLMIGQVAPAAVPEPSSLILLGTGVAALARRRRNSKQA